MYHVIGLWIHKIEPLSWIKMYHDLGVWINVFKI